MEQEKRTRLQEEQVRKEDGRTSVRGSGRKREWRKEQSELKRR